MLPRVFRSVRVRLLVIALLPMLVLLPVMLGSTMLRWSGKIDDILIAKVNGDLTIADQYLGRLLENSGERLDALAQSVALQAVLGDAAARAAFIEEKRRALGLDFLYLTTGRAGPGGFEVGAWPVVRDALAGRRRSVVDIFGPTELDALSPGLAERAAIRLVETRAAVPTERTAETRGMVIHSAAPVALADGSRAALVGGLLLNRNLDFIDTINALVYRERSLPEGSQGTATLFLEDVRVSTNVRLFENVRALGTRVSAAVRARVLGEGQVWLDRAFVVNDWYISGYEPIVDSHGKRVGMLYVGFLEAPFQQAKTTSVLALTLVFLLIAALSVPIFLRWAGRIFLPLERMTQTIARVEAGDLDARNNVHDGDNEITRVAGHLDGLLDQLQERDRQLRDWAGQLNQKVEERTKDLKETNRKLERATERLIMSEKLAAVGEITAGVAHEINNPIAVIQGNLEVARTLLGDETDKVKTEFRLIDDQVYRIGSIVSKLLQFARPSEYSGAANVISPAEVVQDCLVLTRHQTEAAEIETVTDFTSDRSVLMARTELQQVVVNLVLNAVHAMPDGGRLTLQVRDAEDGARGVAIVVEDSGIGMPPDTLKRIFDPFFTTKQAQGTGLGLSISQTLVSRAGGRITAASTPGQGSRFTIFLPESENA
ncbi:signal transduction histidine kinase [Rhodobium orientis]|uniref:histidine kinase n=1 Tax=Rhodobium orientis TaxID=34017 RepID=A0A327JM81_9HYPH|nr:ATP-binding protein [Rhodobium orientis]MBB4301343.1 signal transduction histidine kinase [Rhodobium orientis]MBK5951069.1 two-component sensor histidine kinase [Rhodobium orientis]RAI26865.1 two-component sensor histidine kinase [Rhodobium orientis]